MNIVCLLYFIDKYFTIKLSKMWEIISIPNVPKLKQVFNILSEKLF